MDSGEQLFLMQHSNNSSGDGASQNLYGNMFSPKSDDDPIKDFIESLMKCQQVRFLTFGLNTALDAFKPLEFDISAASIIKFFEVGTVLSGFRIPTPGAAFGLGKKGGRTK